MIDANKIEEYLPHTLEETNLDFLGKHMQGKVRDVYDDGKHIYLIATDRYSAFDRNLTLVPLKGQALTQTSLYNFTQTEDVIKNHVVANPDPNVAVCKKCTVVPVEVIVRGYLTGVTDTAIWTRYANGQRDFTDFRLSDGMKKNQPLQECVVTPTTKFEEHDRNLSFADIIEGEYLTKEKWDEIHTVALKLFARGQELAAASGLILVDTKYEFGYDADGELTLIDEVHTQDSSRYWKADTYDARMEAGEEPEYFDKEFLRLWFKDNCDPYADAELPEAPEDMRIELSRRYIEIYEKLSGQNFEVPEVGSVHERIATNLKAFNS
jgi:phosphoribosylaminoimidazole-succinocarboxamide synthase